MDILYLLKIGEIALKGGNRGFFEKLLKKNILNSVKPAKGRITDKNGRLYLRVPEICSGIH